MITILVDHNMEGQAMTLWGTLAAQGWLEIYSLRLVTFAEVDLPENSSDRTVWRFAQQHGMLLLTDNRRMQEEDSLAKTLLDENTPTSLPVITVGNVKRMVDKNYRDRCIISLLEIVETLDNYRGVGRVFIP